MQLHILGICGTFMGGLALLARGMVHQVSGSDANVYPPMSTQLAEHGVAVHDDFAHHPTAIATTLDGMRTRVGKQRILALLEPRSNTTKMDVHADRLAASLRCADKVLIYEPPVMNHRI